MSRLSVCIIKFIYQLNKNLTHPSTIMADAEPKMTPEEEEAAMIAKMMNGELEDVAPKKKTHITEEEMQIKIMNGEIDPEDVNLKVSTSSWRKQKGDTSVEEQTMADAILNGTYDPDAQGDGPGPTEEEMQAMIMDGGAPTDV